MFDYAANGVRYWPVASLQAAFEDTQAQLGQDPQQVVTLLCGDPGMTVAAYFERVADNLRAGRIRMVFVADVIPDELRRIVEFANEQMNPAEVFAVEVKQYLAAGYPGTVIVPAVYGRTAATTHKGSARRADPQAIRAAADTAARQLMRLLEDFADQHRVDRRDTPSGTRLRAADGSTVAQTYMQYSTLDVDLERVRSRGQADVGEEALELMQAWTAKTLTSKYPAFPAADTVAHWDELEPLLLRLCRIPAPNTATPAERVTSPRSAETPN